MLFAGSQAYAMDLYAKTPTDENNAVDMEVMDAAENANIPDNEDNQPARLQLILADSTLATGGGMCGCGTQEEFNRYAVSNHTECCNVLGDVNCDGVINLEDWQEARFLVGWEKGDPDYIENADMNHDGRIWYNDLATLLLKIKGF